MPTRRFCLVVWGLIVVSLVVFGLLYGRRVFHHAKIFLGVSKPHGVERLVEGDQGAPAGESKAVRAVRFINEASIRSDRPVSAWLGEYRALTGAYPDLRPVLAVHLLEATMVYEDRALHPEQEANAAFAEKAKAAAEVLRPAALAELTALRQTEPENALWPILTLIWDLEQGLRPVPWSPETPRPLLDELAGEAYTIRDAQALGRARQLAEDHIHWGRVDWQVGRVRDLYAEAGRERGLAAYGEVVSIIGAIVPTWARIRRVNRHCLFLGYEALLRGDRAEARRWFDTSLTIGQSMLRRDAFLVETMVAALVLNKTYDALRDWHASSGDFRAAKRMGDRRNGVASAMADIRKGMASDRFVYGVVPRRPMEALAASAYTTASGAAGAILCAFVSAVVAICLAVERRAQRRAVLEAPRVRWRPGDTVWTAAVALAPVALFAAVVVCFPPKAPSTSLPLNLTLVGGAAAAGTALLVGGLSCRRVWRRLREAGAGGRSSPLWLVLGALLVAALAAVALGLIARPGQAGGPVRPVVTAAGLLVLAVAVVALVAGAVTALRRRRPWAALAVRSAWLLRAFGLATLILLLFALASGHVSAARFDAMWAESLKVLDAETEHYLGEKWIDRYFRVQDEPTSQPTTQPAPGPATQGATSAP